MATTPGRVVRTLRHDLGRLTSVVRVLVRNQELMTSELGALKRRVGGEDEPPPATAVIPIRSLAERREARGRGGVRLAAAVGLAGLLLVGVVPQVGPGGRGPSAQAAGTLPDPRPARGHPTTTGSSGGGRNGGWSGWNGNGQQPGGMPSGGAGGPAATVQAARVAAPAAVAPSATEPADAPPTTSTTLPSPTTTSTVGLPTTTLCLPVQRHDCKPDD